MIDWLKRKNKDVDLENIQKELDTITKRLYQENQKIIDKYNRERR